jgi:hypothetical protein
MYIMFYESVFRMEIKINGFKSKMLCCKQIQIDAVEDFKKQFHRMLFHRTKL